MTVAAPPAALRAYVREYVGWFEHTATPLYRREPPTNEIPVIINLGAPVRIFESDDLTRWTDYDSFTTGSFDTYALVGTAGPSGGVQINFTILPEEQSSEPRTYANFCSIAHTPFDFTLTFCEVMPLSEKEVREAAQDHVVRAPVRARIVVPVQFIPNLVAALQEHMRVFQDTYSNVGWSKETPPVH